MQPQWLGLVQWLPSRLLYPAHCGEPCSKLTADAARHSGPCSFSLETQGAPVLWSCSWPKEGIPDRLINSLPQARWGSQSCIDTGALWHSQFVLVIAEPIFILFCIYSVQSNSACLFESQGTQEVVNTGSGAQFSGCKSPLYLLLPSNLSGSCFSSVKFRGVWP